MSTTATALITAEEFARMQFDEPVELVRGELFFPYREDPMTRPSPGHGWVALEIGGLLRNWTRTSGLGRVVSNDSWITTGRDPDTVRGADVAYYPIERLPGGKLPLKPGDLVPDLCVEILSPSDRWADVHDKISEYFGCGVLEVWIANPQRRTIEVFRPDEPPATYRDDDEITSRLLPGFAVRTAACFEGV